MTLRNATKPHSAVQSGLNDSSLTSEFARSLNGLVNGLETSQQSVVIVGADLVFLDQVPVEVIQLSVALLHHGPAMNR